MIISIDAERAFDKIQYPLTTKKTKKTRNRMDVHQYNKGFIQETYSLHFTKWGKLKLFHLKSGMRQGYLLSPFY
jgi:hypothetical protein